MKLAVSVLFQDPSLGHQVIQLHQIYGLLVIILELMQVPGVPSNAAQQLGLLARTSMTLTNAGHKQHCTKGCNVTEPSRSLSTPSTGCQYVVCMHLLGAQAASEAAVFLLTFDLALVLACTT